MSRQPEVLWAQRSDKVYLTISLPDAKDVSAKSEPEGFFSFSAIGPQGEPFRFDMELYEPILPEYIEEEKWSLGVTMLHAPGCFLKSKVHFGLRNIICTIQKEKKGWWKRLLKSEEKPAPYIKVDWNKWCDEDEMSENSDWPASDDDENGVVDDDADEGDESDGEDGLLYLPDLEKARGK